MLAVPVSKPIRINVHHVTLFLCGFPENSLELERFLVMLYLGIYLFWSLNQTTTSLAKESSASIPGTQLPPVPATNQWVVGILLPQFRCAHNTVL